jgi:hypothetical protein
MQLQTNGGLSNSGRLATSAGCTKYRAEVFLLAKSGFLPIGRSFAPWLCDSEQIQPRSVSMKIQILAVAASLALLAGCTTSRETMGYAERVSFEQLPPAVQMAVRNKVGDEPVARIDKETKYGQQSYRVEVERPGLNPALWVAADGSILKESGRLARGGMSEAAGGQAPSSSSGYNQ